MSRVLLHNVLPIMVELTVTGTYKMVVRRLVDDKQRRLIDYEYARKFIDSHKHLKDKESLRLYIMIAEIITQNHFYVESNSIKNIDMIFEFLEGRDFTHRDLVELASSLSFNEEYKGISYSSFNDIFLDKKSLRKIAESKKLPLDY